MGKEVFADLIQSKSSRLNRPYLKINCAAIPKELIESELFGHKKGSFTGATSDKKGLFEAADKGTIFLDEIGELPAEAQVNLLRALESRTIERLGGNRSVEVDVRVDDV